MSKRRMIAGALALTLGAGGISALAADPTVSAQEWLVQADRARLPESSLLVETEVRSYRRGELDKERLYSVYVKPGRRSIVLSRSPSEKGQKILMSGDDFWIILPDSRRPVKITPMQKLLGDASTGDIASLSWSEDYRGVLRRQLQEAGEAMRELELRAVRTGVTYAKVLLTVRVRDGAPIRAELFVSEEKAAKQAEFHLEPGDKAPLVQEMVIQDLLQEGRKTVIRYKRRSARSVADRYFNPMTLVQGGPDE